MFRCEKYEQQWFLNLVSLWDYLLLQARFRLEVSLKLECSIVFILGKVNILFFKRSSHLIFMFSPIITRARKRAG